MLQPPIEKGAAEHETRAISGQLASTSIDEDAEPEPALVFDEPDSVDEFVSDLLDGVVEDYTDGAVRESLCEEAPVVYWVSEPPIPEDDAEDAEEEDWDDYNDAVSVISFQDAELEPSDFIVADMAGQIFSSVERNLLTEFGAGCISQSLPAKMLDAPTTVPLAEHLLDDLCWPDTAAPMFLSQLALLQQTPVAAQQCPVDCVLPPMPSTPSSPTSLQLSQAQKAEDEETRAEITVASANGNSEGGFRRRLRSQSAASSTQEPGTFSPQPPAAPKPGRPSLRASFLPVAVPTCQAPAPAEVPAAAPAPVTAPRFASPSAPTPERAALRPATVGAIATMVPTRPPGSPARSARASQSQPHGGAPVTSTVSPRKMRDVQRERAKRILHQLHAGDSSSEREASRARSSSLSSRYASLGTAEIFSLSAAQGAGSRPASMRPKGSRSAAKAQRPSGTGLLPKLENSAITMAGSVSWSLCRTPRSGSARPTDQPTR